jgi:hypothetical protein
VFGGDAKCSDGCGVGGEVEWEVGERNGGGGGISKGWVIVVKLGRTGKMVNEIGRDGG